MATRWIRFSSKYVGLGARGVSVALAVLLCGSIWCAAANAAVVSYNLDFETEDDFVTPLVNGQSISTFPDVQDAKGNLDSVFEFGRLVNISTQTFGFDGHEGAAIFDSTPGGPNDTGGVHAPAVDPDLLVDKGNILMLQNDLHPSTSLDPTYGLTFDVPDDEAQFEDYGAIVFDFTMPVELTSIDLIDVDDDCRFLTLMLVDENMNRRVYDVPSNWTNDITWGAKGWHTLDLTTLAEQLGDTGTNMWTDASEDWEFDPYRVVQLKITIDGSSAIDNLRFTKEIEIPEPSSLAIAILASIALIGRRRRR